MVVMGKPAFVDTHAPFLALLGELNATPTDAKSKAWTFQHEGRSFTIAWVAPGKNTPPKLDLKTSAGPMNAPVGPAGAFDASGPYRDGWTRARYPGTLHLRLETGIDRFGKRIRLNREVEVGDAAFDDRIYIECEGPDDDVRGVLASPTTRMEVVACLEMGATYVRLREGVLEIERPLLTVEGVQRHNVVMLASALGRAAEAMPVLTPAAPRSLLAKMRFAILIAAIVAAPASCGTINLTHAIWEPLDSSLTSDVLLVSPVLWIAFTVAIVALMRGRSTAFRDVVLAAGLGLFSVPLGVNSLVTTVNGALDRSPPLQRPGVVVKRWYSSGKTTTYYLQIRPDDGSRPHYQLSVASSLYHQVSQGSRITMTTHAGRLGYEWLVSLTPTR